MASSVVLRGTALHRGGPAEVRLVRRRGPVVVVQRGATARLDELRAVRTDRGVTVATEDGRVRVDLIEHLLAAVGGLGVSDGLAIEAGDEIPLLDGGAHRFVEALSDLELPLHETRPLRVTREAEIAHERSVYRFAPGAAPSVRVDVDLPAPVGRQRAAWAGGVLDFAERIAPARTFGWTRELDALRAAGRAAAVDLESVIVFDERGSLAACRAPDPDEPARHKLLDLIGDLTLYGGPPLGEVDAFFPGHTATHAIATRALSMGVLA